MEPEGEIFSCILSDSLPSKFKWFQTKGHVAVQSGQI